jgi:hypothetical protein
LALDEFGAVVSDQVRSSVEFCRRVTDPPAVNEECAYPNELLAEIQRRMTEHAAQIRNPATIAAATEDAWSLVRELDVRLHVTGAQSLPMAFRVADLSLTHAVYLEAIGAYLAVGGGSRGGVLVLDPDGERCGAGLDSSWSFRVDDANNVAAQKILEVQCEQVGLVKSHWVDVRPIPQCDGWFEQVWADFRSGKVFTGSEED